jgi:hypothetical protein
MVSTVCPDASTVERLSGPLCAAVTGRADSQQLLEQVGAGQPVPDPLG